MLEAAITFAFADDPLDRGELTAGESAQLGVLGSEQRATEWLRGRAALRSVLVKRGAAGDTSALSFPNPCYSVSHSDELAVAAGADAAGTGVSGLGIDFERFKPIREDAARFFLEGAELAWVGSLPRERRPTELLRLWTVKEALFKADLENAGRTLRDYRTSTPAALEGAACTPTSLPQQYTTIITHGGYLTVAITRGRRTCWPRTTSGS